MALDTYANLKAAIATRLHRSDLTANIVDYVTLAEKRINRMLKLTNEETEAPLTASISSRSLTLPSLFGSPIALYLTTYLPRIKLVYKLPEEMQVYSSNGPSSFWTIDGTVIKTDVPADIAYTYTLRYSAEYNIASTSTNAALTNYPDTYFYGALIEAYIELKNPAQQQVSEKRFTEAIRECLDDQHAQRSLAELRTEFVPADGRPNIIRGF